MNNCNINDDVSDHISSILCAVENDHWYIPLNSTTLTTLGQIIKPYPLPMNGGDLFFNSNGPNSNKTSSGIYISCNPTGSSTETTDVVYDTNTVTPIDFNAIWDNPAFKLIVQILIACSLFIVIFYVLNMISIYSTKI
jgi:hypothetical protein